jgi:hypothetical protein
VSHDCTYNVGPCMMYDRFMLLGFVITEDLIVPVRYYHIILSDVVSLLEA